MPCLGSQHLPCRSPHGNTAHPKARQPAGPGHALNGLGVKLEPLQATSRVVAAQRAQFSTTARATRTAPP